jgi:2-polyprenyl-3-methyl-5-hydroxy-6-metoxy-1,4-benzoquinol methylase
MRAGVTTESRCAACGSGPLIPGVSIARAALADAWRREDEAVGADDTARQRFDTLLATLPAEVRFDRCPNCGLQMASPSIVWSATTYPRDQSYPVRWEFERAAGDLGAAPLDLLELGCGAGHFRAMVAARGHRAVGLDFSEPAVVQAQARGLNAFCGGLDELPRIVGAGERFDACAMFHLIEHLADPAAFLRAVGRWLRPQAHIFISCPGPRRFTRLITEQQVGGSDFWDHPPQHVARWTLPALQALLERAGWRVTTGVEEPFSWTAAASHIGVARAIYRRQLNRPVARRALIAAAWLRLALEPRRRAGVSLYTTAVREGSGA